MLPPSPSPRRPTLEDYDRFLQLCEKSEAVMEVAQADFESAGHLQTTADTPSNRRALVRAFGTFLEAMTWFMRDTACLFCEMHGRELNPYLRAKAGESTSTAYHRIVVSYRLVAEFMPKCPIARIPEDRWESLRRGIAIRNRVTHPTSVEDLAVSPAEMDLIWQLAIDFLRDHTAFLQCATREEEKAIFALGGQRKRITPKIGRNDPCPCKSGRKFKACCGREN